MYTRKTRDRWDLMSNYGYGWDCECSDYTYKEAIQTLREYRENGSGVYRLEKHREPIPETIIEQYKNLIEKIVAEDGGYREKLIIKQPYTFKQSGTWNNSHKVINVLTVVPEADGHRPKFAVDIVTNKIVG